MTNCRAAEQVKEVIENSRLQVAMHFPCPIYFINRPDFLTDVSEVSEQYLQVQRKDKQYNEIYPVYMSHDYSHEDKVKPFAQFISNTAWNILNEQGFMMHDKLVYVNSMWTQEHHKHSGMEQHVHGYGAQIVGFYFLEVPRGSPRVLFHDPRMGKLQVDLPEQNVSNATVASQIINFVPQPGLVMFTNSWLAHSFTRHAAEAPIKFVHFNLSVQMNQGQSAEVV